MKKVLLSLFVLAASGGYVWSQSGRIGAENALAANGPGAPAADSASALPAGAAPQVKPMATSVIAQPAPAVLTAPAAVAPLPPQRIVADAPIPLPPLPIPRPQTAPRAPQAQILPAATLVAQSQTQFKDGSYKGPVTDAYYGNMQVQANIQGGQLASVKVLQYPADRRTSRNINSQALPMLQQEVISAQSASVDTVSGATLSSRAYIKSLAGALKQATAGQTNL
ncbi:MAG: hypothetical protein JWN11_2753 [Hyphomicrobiales bacterium]|nr:hypothetical protein [Hyphomicrobiales bacterium]